MDANHLARPRLTGPVAYSTPPPRPYRRLHFGEIPELGAHLFTPWMGFAHHGIYVGEGKVIHYGALVYDILRRPVEEVTLQQFAGGRAMFVVKHESLPFPCEEVVRRAKSRIGENKYRLLTNNCEHFVEWCLYDVQRSFQVNRALEYPRQMGERIQTWLTHWAMKLFGGRRRPVTKS